MNKDYFLRELEYLLSDVTEEERREALQYYRDYFDEAGPGREAEILAHIGSPEKVAAEIKSGLEGNRDAGEFTERGYSDSRFEEAPHVPDQYAEIVKSNPAGNEEKQNDTGENSGYWEEDRRSKWWDEEREARRTARAGNAGNRRSGLLLVLLFVFFGLPLAGSIISGGFSIIAAVIGGLIGIFGGLFSLVIGAFAAAFGLLVSGVTLIINGCCNMAMPALGTMAIALGFFSLAAALLLVAVGKWGCTTAVPGVFRLSARLVRRFCRFAARIVHRLLGRGGADR